MQAKDPNKGWILIPVFGAFLFVILYVLAALHYPGGSEFDHQAKGFSWLHNYWCNLLNEDSISGEPNTGRPIAIGAFVVLGLTLLSFWYIYSMQMQFQKISRLIIISSGLLCFVSLCFLSSTHHDTIINIGGFFGLLAMAGIYYSIFQNRWYGFFASGVFNLLLIAANNYIYYTKDGFGFLPVLQKITFLAVLLWICAIDLRLYFLSKYTDVS